MARSGQSSWRRNPASTILVYLRPVEGGERADRKGWTGKMDLLLSKLWYKGLYVLFMGLKMLVHLSI